MKKALLSLLLTLLLATIPAYSQPPTIIQQAQQATVLVEVPADGETAFFCTGIKVGIVRVLTAHHCIPPQAENIHVNGIPNARIVKQTNDGAAYDGLILLEVQPQFAPIMKLAEKEPQPGDGVVSLGFVDRIGTKVVLRRSIAGYGLNEASKLMAVDGTLIRGMSGGPVVNEKGELVGVHQSVNGGIGLVTRLEAIRKFLK